jgi:hypothetical protein
MAGRRKVGKQLARFGISAAVSCLEEDPVSSATRTWRSIVAMS